MVEYLVYVSLVLLVTVGGLLALAVTTRDVRGREGFALDIASALVVGLFIAALAATTVL
jgi:ABC-type Fe3+ transport system permease subunit